MRLERLRARPVMAVYSCAGKDAMSAEQALSVARRMKRGGKTVQAYRCPSCQAWHVGRPSKV